MIIAIEWILYGVPVLVVLFFYQRHQRRVQRRSQLVQENAIESGLTEAPSLHPVIDPALCVGSGACVRACPETAIGIIERKGILVNPSSCIGHGACAASCPVGAITLVFGSERRGMDIPYVKPTFETNVPGIYIAGELGGMGLIGKSAEQGRQAVQSVVQQGRPRTDLDLVIVGTGPAGISAALAAMENKLRYAIIEQEDSLGGTVYHYPRNKVVMTHPVDLAGVGKVKLGEISKESLLGFWQKIIDQSGMEIQFGERLQSIDKLSDEEFRLNTEKSQFHASNVLLAIGRRGTPRKLGVPGEELSKVVYRLIEANQYQGQHVLVVGGGDSAIEAALAIADEPETQVALSYRSAAFSRAKVKNRDAIAAAQSRGRIQVFLGSTIDVITEDSISLQHQGDKIDLPNQAVIVCAGGILPIPMLQDIGVMVETKYGTA